MMDSVDFAMTVIFVEDIEVSKCFYQRLFGFQIDHDFGENIVFKNAFSLWQRKRARQIIFGDDQYKEKCGGKKHTELYFETSHIDEIWVNLKREKDVDIIHGIKEENWGQKTIRLFDPDGFVIEIAEPMPVVVKRLSMLGCSVEDIAQKTQIPVSEVQVILDK
ncbi:MAG: glyoxalase [Thermoplasmatota archaeon]